MPLYHVSQVMLGPGSTILPGNFGRIIAAVGPAHTWWVHEHNLEIYRAAEFPTKPRRAHSAYACLDQATAEVFRDTSCKNGVLYEVEVVDPSRPCHEGDFNGALHQDTVNPATMAPWIRRYWQGDHMITLTDRPGVTACREIVVESPLRVVRML